ncbi:uncharacterized protein LOC118433823 [Folsomia candida]|uniref:uncharacterized protein LOC118433637 n=1 Tax=Folsomia candida TaxID=158441 RepID=UPI00160544E8|nr:uncharacterized protein LOC118433637 [Folsomia candida]XP_035702018.1 uncharacterized protein LOC118433823 [Folsomia candida]
MKLTFEVHFDSYTVQQMKFVTVVIGANIVTLIPFFWEGASSYTVLYFVVAVFLLIIDFTFLVGDAFIWKISSSDMKNMEIGLFTFGGLVHQLCSILMLALERGKSTDWNDNKHMSSLQIYVAVG